MRQSARSRFPECLCRSAVHLPESFRGGCSFGAELGLICHEAKPVSPAKDARITSGKRRPCCGCEKVRQLRECRSEQLIVRNRCSNRPRSSGLSCRWGDLWAGLSAGARCQSVAFAAFFGHVDRCAPRVGDVGFHPRENLTITRGDAGAAIVPGPRIANQF